jgi:hypothetical protein
MRAAAVTRVKVAAAFRSSDRSPGKPLAQSLRTVHRRVRDKTGRSEDAPRSRVGRKSGRGGCPSGTPERRAGSWVFSVSRRLLKGATHMPGFAALDCDVWRGQWAIGRPWCVVEGPTAESVGSGRPTCCSGRRCHHGVGC